MIGAEDRSARARDILAPRDLDAVEEADDPAERIIEETVGALLFLYFFLIVLQPQCVFFPDDNSFCRTVISRPQLHLQRYLGG